jgi:hypothetical protein
MKFSMNLAFRRIYRRSLTKIGRKITNAKGFGYSHFLCWSYSKPAIHGQISH